MIKLNKQQTGLYHEIISNPDSDMYNTAAGISIQGELDVKKFKRACNKCFKLFGKTNKIIKKDNELYHKIIYYANFYLITNNKNCTLNDAIKELKRLSKQKYDLSNGPMVKFYLMKYKLGYLFSSQASHLSNDGTSALIVFKVIEKLYNKSVYLKVGKVLKFFNFKIKTQEQCLKAIKENKTTYWVEVLKGAKFHLDFMLPINKTFKNQGGREYFELDNLDRILNLKEFSRTTMFVILCTAFNAFLYRYFEQNDIVLLYPCDMRPKNFKFTLGFLVNTLLLRTKIKIHTTFLELVTQISNQRLKDRKYKYTPFNDLLKDLKIEKREINVGIIQTKFEIGMKLKNLNVTPIELQDFNEVQNELSLLYQVIGDKIKLCFEYKKRIFNKSFIIKMKNNFKMFIDELLNNTDKPIENLKLLDEYQYNYLVNGLNDTKVNFKIDTIHRIFEKKSEQHKNQVALEYLDKTITYQELNERANQLARFLKEYSKLGDYVGVCLEKSIDLIICIFAIFKSGGIYFPIDYFHPKQRMEFMIEDTKCSLILTEDKFISLFKDFGLQTINIKKINTKNEQKDNLDNIKVNELAYIMFTSGSTGKPKGVIMEHQNFVSYALSQIIKYNLNQGDRFSLYSNIGFDVSLDEIFSALYMGMTLVIIPEEIRLNVDALYNFFVTKEIDGCFLPPAILKVFPKKPMNIKAMLIGGDACDYDTMKYWSQQVQTFINGYGPTECQFSHYKIWNSKCLATNIGRPYDNYTSYILDKNKKLKPLNIPGELYIGGPTVARGYLNRKKLTKEKFLKNPFGEGRIYKTGDLVRYKSNGDIVFLGRIDFQVKIKGRRIELEEIECVIKEMTQIKNVVVLKKDEKLIAFITLNTNIKGEEIKIYCSKQLPYYMIPSIFTIKKFPITINGKIDRNELLKIDVKVNDNIEPRNFVEIELKKIWKIIIKGEFGITNDFFELGGDSLSIHHVLSLIEKKLNVRLTLKEFYENPSILKLGQFISTKKPKNKNIKRILKRGRSSSFAQRRMYFMEHYNNQSNLSMIPLIFEYDNYKELEKGINIIIQRHESLRMTFKFGDKLESIVKKELNFKFELKDGDTETRIQEELETPFNLTTGPLIRGSVIKNIIILNIHHIIFDFFSLKVFLNELNLIRQNKPLGKTYQYFSFINWQKEYLKENLETLKVFWSRLKDYPSLLKLPFQINRNDFNGRTKIYNFVSKELDDFCLKKKITPFIFLFSAFSILIQKYSKNNKFLIGVPFSNRNFPGSETIIGYLVNVLPFYVNFELVKNNVELFEHVKATLFDIDNHQHMPFDMLIKDLKREKNVNPLFQVMFNYAGKLKDLEFNPIDININRSRFDLSLDIIKINETFKLIFEFPTSIKEYMVDNLCKQFNMIIDNLLKKINFNKISLLSKEDRKMQMNIYKSLDLSNESVAMLLDTTFKNYKNLNSVQVGETSITYQELNKRSNELANYLKTIGIKAGSIVGVYFDKGIELIVSIVAILKLNATYLPIDKKLPIDRIDIIKKDTNCEIIISDTDLNFNTLNLSNVGWESSQFDIPQEVNLDLICYIIYTSGSTGKPKGIQLTQKNFLNFYTNYKSIVGLKPGDKFGVYCSISFDLSISEILTSLLCGLTLVIIPDDIRIDGLRLTKFISEKNIKGLFITPITLKLLDRDVKTNLKSITIAGDKCDYDTMKFWSNNVKTFIHGYGPAETTIITHGKMWNDEYKFNNVGKPFANITQYILDEKLNIVPLGFSGEIYLGGKCVARGYINKDELNEKKFILNPFNSSDILYKTGDLGKYDKNGNLLILGRSDSQVKIRGFRIELGEIENSLKSHKYVKNAIILIKQDMIIAFIILWEVVKDAKNDLIKYLQKKLPYYMIPNSIIFLDKFPLSLNGKVDTKKLRQLKINKPFVEPTSETEIKLVKIWKNILNVEKVGITDNYFELGGNSFNLIKLVKDINLKFKKNIKPDFIFESPTIKHVAREILRGTDNGMQIYERPSKIPLSFNQEAMYFLDKTINIKETYNCPLCFNIKGKFNFDKMEMAFKKLIKRHEILRTNFILTDKEVYQEILPSLEFSMELVDIKECEIKTYLNERINMRFDLSKAPLIRANVLRIDEHNFIFLIVVHHIIFDHWSIYLIFDELKNFYENSNSLIELKYQYADYSVWQRKMFKDDKFRSQIDYWKKELSELPDPLNLPTDFPLNSKTGNMGKKILVTIKDNELYSRINFSIFEYFISCFLCLINNYTNQNDIIIGIPTSNRHVSEFNNLIGYFNNNVPLRVNISRGDTISKLIEKVKKKIKGANQNQDIPFNKIVKCLNRSIISNQNPIFQICFVFFESHKTLQKFEFSDFKAELLNYFENGTKFDLIFYVNLNNKDINVLCEYSTGLFKEQTIRHMIDHYINILNRFSKDTTLKIEELSILSKNDYNTQVYQWNESLTHVEFHNTIQEIFENVVKQYPKNIAVEFKNETINYEDLNNKSNQVGLLLRENYKIKPENFVGICIEKSIELIISIIGVFKSSGAYFPMDSNSPEKRLEYMIKDTNCQLIIISSKFMDKFKFFKGEILKIEKITFDKIEKNLSIINTFENLAYVIYTSGSTGKPKGVLIEHKGIINTILSLYSKYRKFCNPKKISLYSSIIFDASISEFLTCLFHGLTCVIIPEEIRLNIPEMSNYIEEKHVDFVLLVPSILKRIKKLNNVNTIKIVGEACDYDTMKRWAQKKKLINGYGPTEISICSHIKLWNVNDLPTNIGSPLYNVKYYIMDSNLRIVPIGIPGELYIGGIGVSRGYLNMETLTKERFITSPFNPKEIIYKTGDLCKYLPNGEVEFLRRIDSQVKIRGIRIELREIESLLKQVTNDSVVIIKDNKIRAFVISKDKDRKFLMDHLRLYLPSYMIPNNLIFLDEFPLNFSGKVDKKKLLKFNNVKNEIIKPNNLIEQKLVKLWEEKLGCKQVSVDNNFFGLGGDSLNLINMIKTMNREFDANLKPETIIEDPTIKGISKYLEKSIMLSEYKITCDVRPEFIPLSFSQERMYFLNSILDIKEMYNCPFYFKISGDLDIKKLERTINKIICRHEILRTTFESNDLIFQKINAPFEIKMSLEKKISRNDIDDPFELSKLPLFRVKLSKDGDDFIFLIVFHHIIFDHWSIFIFFDELAKLYNGKKVDTIKIQYADYSIWEKRFFKTVNYENQMNYWKLELKELKELNLYSDNNIKLSNSGDNYFKNLKELDEVKDYSKNNKIPIRNVFLSMFATLLYVYSNQDDVSILLPITNRHCEGVDNLIGFFTNMLPLRLQNFKDKSLIEILKIVEFKINNLNKNQDVPFEKLIDILKLNRKVNSNPLSKVCFVFFENDKINQNLNLVNTKVDIIPLFEKGSKFDVTFYITLNQEGCHIRVEYSTDLFKESTIIKMVEVYKLLMLKLIREPTKKFNDLCILNDLEIEKLKVYNDTKEHHNFVGSIKKVFENKAQELKNEVAVEFKDRKLTYEELNNSSNLIAHNIKEKLRGKFIGVCLDKSIELIQGILSVIKLGRTYFPINPHLPEKRIEFMVKDTKCETLLIDSKFRHMFSFFKGNIIELNNFKVLDQIKSNPDVVINQSDLAYIIYTSGSTGQPKGVLIEHLGFLNTVYNRFKNIELSIGDKFSQFMNISFDASITEIFTPLLNGLTLCIIPEEIRIDSEKLFEFIKDKKINGLTLPPAILKQLPRKKLEDLKTLIILGENSEYEVMEYWSKHVNVFFNEYGPTEISVASHAKKWTSKCVFNNIGKPYSNVKTYIVNNNLQLQPIGLPGELVIGGIGVSRGYLNNSILTNEKFISFKSNGMVYRTGDLCKYENDDLIFLGRIDNQIKLRGYRIELCEIEYHIKNHKKIRDSIVVINDTQIKKLVSFIILDTEECDKIKDELEYHLMSILPDYMIPSDFIILKKFPLNYSGKIDRKILSNFIPNKNTETIAKTEIEKTISRVFCDVLQIKKIDIHENFFNVGVNSILSYKIINRIYQVGIFITIKEFYSNQTIKKICSIVTKKIKSYSTEIPTKSFDLTPYQKCLLENIFIIEVNKSFNEIRDVFVDMIERNPQIRSKISKNLQKFDNISIDDYIVKNYRPPLKKLFQIVSLEDKTIFLFDEKIFDGYSINLFLKPKNKVQHNLFTWVNFIDKYIKSIDFSLNKRLWIKQLIKHKVNYKKNKFKNRIVILSKEETSKIKKIEKLYRVNIIEICLCLIYLTFKKKINVLITTSNRNSILGINMLDCVGNFSSNYMISIKNIDSDIGMLLFLIKYQHRLLPSKKFTFELIKNEYDYHVSLNYIGKIENVSKISRRHESKSNLSIFSYILDNKMHFDIFKRIKFVKRFKKVLKKFISYCLPVAPVKESSANFNLVLNFFNYPSNETIINLQEFGSKLPLFIIHPLLGHSSIYIELSEQLSKLSRYDQPIFGINFPDQQFKTFEDLALHYTKEIIKKQPIGPYQISGFSLGGVIAFEVCQQLKKIGKDVKILIMSDCMLRRFKYKIKNDKHLKKLISKVEELEDLRKFILDTPKKNLNEFVILYKNIKKLLYLRQDYCPKGMIDNAIFIKVFEEKKEEEKYRNNCKKYVKNLGLYFLKGKHEHIFKELKVEIAKIFHKNL